MIDEEINKFLSGQIEDPLEQVRVLKGWVKQLSEQNSKLSQQVEKVRLLSSLLKELS